MQTLPPEIERHEFEYLVPKRFIEPISCYLAPYCELDAHSRAHDNGFYAVNSLYFDTPGLRFLKQRIDGIDRRFNMRVRAYGDGSELPFFAEVKYKLPTSVRKFRALIQTRKWPEMFGSAGVEMDLPGQTPSPDATSMALFQHLAIAYAIEPKVFTCYRRRAFVSQVDAYARVTMDIDMRYRVQERLHSVSPFSLQPDAQCQNYDLQTIYSDEANDPANVVLELKAEVGAVPLWMLELIRRFELKQIGFSKYMQSSLNHRWDSNDVYMSMDRAAGETASVWA